MTPASPNTNKINNVEKTTMSNQCNRSPRLTTAKLGFMSSPLQLNRLDYHSKNAALNLPMTSAFLRCLVTFCCTKNVMATIIVVKETPICSK